MDLWWSRTIHSVLSLPLPNFTSSCPGSEWEPLIVLNRGAQPELGDRSEKDPPTSQMEGNMNLLE